jgi:hypothetical protein
LETPGAFFREQKIRMKFKPGRASDHVMARVDQTWWQASLPAWIGLGMVRHAGGC